MTWKLSLSVLGAATLLGGGALALDGADSCNYEETRPFFFSSWEEADIAAIRISGNSCAESIVLVTIANGEQVFSHKAELRALTAVPNDDLSSSDALKIAKSAWALLGPRRTSALQPWKEPQTIYDLADEIPLLDREAYEHARAIDRPYICVQSYYEGADCYWLDQSGGVSKLLKLSD